MQTGSWIRVEGLRFRCVIGVTAREREAPQEIIVDLEVKIDFGKAATSDRIDDTVDYRVLSRRLIEAGAASRFQLVEALASHLARVILDEFPRVEALRLELEKPGALSAIARSVRAVIVASREPA
jgi:dihydroneopterin aldolase